MAKWLIWSAIALVLVVGAGAAVVYTEQPSFCPTCHEMGPYYDAWRLAAHDDVSCMDCHVESGPVNRVAHKFVALKEVWVHVTSSPKFPMYTAEVPDHRCTTCHESVTIEDPPPGFDHGAHASAGSCQSCHPSTGHSVMFEALRSAGVLDESAAASQTSEVTGELLAADPEPQRAPGHGDVSCGSCHNMPAAGCDYCHMPPENHFVDRVCSDCHVPGTPFEGAAFSHSGDLNCVDCHDAPPNHFPGGICRSCHEPGTPFEQATFSHPHVGEHGSSSFPCEKCHPGGYASSSCTCHDDGVPMDD